MIEIKNLKYKFLTSINLKLDSSGLYGLYGKSGSGKTTLLRIIAGFLKPENGEILFKKKQQEDFQPRKWRQKISYLSHPVYFFPGNVRYNLTYAMKYITDYKEPEWDLWFNEINLSPNILSQNALLLSAGEKQRLGLLRLLSLDPDIILLDEPTSNLDNNTAIKVMNFLKKIAKKKIILIVSHKPEMLEWFKKIFILQNGNIITNQNIHKDILNKKLKELGIFS